MPFQSVSANATTLACKPGLTLVGSDSMLSPRSRLPLIGVECILLVENYNRDEQCIFDLWDSLKNNFTAQTKQMAVASQDKCLFLMQKVEDILDNGGFELGEKEYAELSLCFEKLRKSFSQQGKATFWGDLSALSRALEVETKAKWAERCHSQALSIAEEKYHQFNRPGTCQEKAGSVSLGAGFGSEVAGIGLKAGGGMRGGFASSMVADDDGAVLVRKQFALGAFGKGGVGVASAEVEVAGKVTYLEAYNSAKHYAGCNVVHKGSRQQSLGQRRGLSRKNELAKYPKIVQAAVNQRPGIVALCDQLRTPTFASKNDCSQSAPERASSVAKGLHRTSALLYQGGQIIPDNPHVHTVLELYSPSSIIRDNKPVAPVGNARARGIKLSGSMGVEASGFSASLGGNIEKTTIKVKSPTSLKAVVESKAEDLERSRLKHVLKSSKDAAYKRFPEVRRILDDWFFSKESVSEKKLNDLVNVLENQFKKLCLKAQEYDHKVETASARDRKALKGKLDVVWNREFKDARENVLADLCKLHALLLHQASKCDSKEAVLARLEDLGAQLYAPPIAFDKKMFDKATSFTDTLKINKYSRTVELKLGAAISAFGIGGKAIFTETRFIQHNVFRAGDYRDLTLTLTGAISDTGCLNKMAESLAKQINLPGVSADRLSAELGKITGDLQFGIEGNVKVMFRFFQPNYQNAEGFPDKARGYQLQLTRVSTDRIMKLAGGVSIPTPVAGLTVDLGMKLNDTVSDVDSERWGESSLSAPMMHYMNLKGIGESARWAALSNACLYEKSATGSDSFLKLAGNLINEQSAVHHEATYFLQRQQECLGVDDRFKELFFIVMQKFVDQPDNQINRELAQLVIKTLMERQFPLWEEEKLRFVGRTRGIDIQL